MVRTISKLNIPKLIESLVWNTRKPLVKRNIESSFLLREGGIHSSIVYTMVEMAKAYHLNVYDYLVFLLENRPTDQMTDGQLSELTPWSEKSKALKIACEL